MPNINVTVFDSTENKRVPVELPDDAPANKLIAVLVEKLKLPKSGPDGAPLSYKFHHKNSGKQVQDAQSLAQAGVKEGDILRLQPEITAGSWGWMATARGSSVCRGGMGPSQEL
ncbi:MAG: EsaB/YukD family protein [Verrucomicrobia bacterium]|nr:EsaB/YukD family protein [Verrucomicrobiota bacterium]